MRSPSARAADTISITAMGGGQCILAFAGAMAAGLTSGLLWSSLAASLVVAFFISLPVNRALISRGKGHAVMHEYHAH